MASTNQRDFFSEPIIFHSKPINHLAWSETLNGAKKIIEQKNLRLNRSNDLLSLEDIHSLKLREQYIKERKSRRIKKLTNSITNEFVLEKKDKHLLETPLTNSVRKSLQLHPEKFITFSSNVFITKTSIIFVLCIRIIFHLIRLMKIVKPVKSISKFTLALVKLSVDGEGNFIDGSQKGRHYLLSKLKHLSSLYKNHSGFPFLLLKSLFLNLVSYCSCCNKCLQPVLR